MPLTDKGARIKSAMTKKYGAKKGERVFYASKNAGKIKGVDADPWCKMKGLRSKSAPARDSAMGFRRLVARKGVRMPAEPRLPKTP